VPGVRAVIVRAIRGFDRRSGIFSPHGARLYAAVSPRVLRPFYRRVVDDAARFVGERDALIVDLGSGPGELTRMVAERLPGARMVGVEPAEVMRTMASARGGRFVDGRAEAIPLEDASVDLVVSTLSAHHWSDMPAALRELDRVLRPGAEAWIYDLRFAAYGPEDLARIGAEAGIEPVRLSRSIVPGRLVRPFALIRLRATLAA